MNTKNECITNEITLINFMHSQGRVVTNKCGRTCKLVYAVNKFIFYQFILLVLISNHN